MFVTKMATAHQITEMNNKSSEYIDNKSKCSEKNIFKKSKELDKPHC